jgi:hypothetical protein
MNFQNLKSGFRLIFVGLIASAVRFYAEKYFPNKILIMGASVVSIVFILWGSWEIYQEFKRSRKK